MQIRQPLGQFQKHGLARNREGEYSRHIAPDGHESRVPKGKQTAETVGNIQADGQNYIYSNEVDNGKNIFINRAARKSDKPDSAEDKGRKNQTVSNPIHQVRSSIFLPRIPFGIINRIKMRVVNTKASRKAE